MSTAPGKRRRISSVALVACLGVAIISTTTVFFSRNYMASYWGGGNFPPLVGHLAVILVGGLLFLANGVSIAAIVLSLIGIIRTRRAGQVGRWYIAALVVSSVLFVVQIKLWSTA